jgi:hypothetical protein
MKITAKMLEDKGACKDQIDIFREEWPRGATVTKKNALRAVELGLDIYWAAERFLTAAAWAEYEKVEAAARVEYNKVTAAAWAEYKKVSAKVRAAAWAEYHKVTAAALAKYEKVRAAALAEYKKACALAFVKLAKAG